MKRLLHNIYAWIASAAKVLAREMHLVTHDVGVMIFFFLLPTAYPVVYTLIYNPEVVTDLPVAVVDHSRTARSREFVRTAEASPAIAIYAYCSNLGEAKALMAENKVFGILEIPSDYSNCIGQGRQATIQFYAEMSLLLRYRTFVAALTDLQMKMASDITIERVEALGGSSLEGMAGLPVESRSNFLGDTEQGFASFVIPGIVVLILQQSMLLGICMLGGTANDRRRRNRGYDPLQPVDYSSSATVWGRALCYTLLYIPCAIYILMIIPGMFHLPHIGSSFEALVYIFPMLLGTAFLGQVLNRWMKERESAFMMLVFTSVLFLFLSGLTWPRYAMSPLWRAVGDLVPATWGVEGFIRINSNGGTIAENAHPYAMMWALAAAYFLLAWLVTALDRRRHSAPPTTPDSAVDQV